MVLRRLIVKFLPLLILLAVAAAVLNMLYPRLAWRRVEPLPVRVKLVDYTVPFDNYREHGGLIWLLNHLKVPTPNRDPLWLKNKHYEGYYPHKRDWPDRVAARPPISADFVYVADTYGVYYDDIKGAAERRAHMDYSPLVFGGLSLADAKRFESFAHRGGFLMVEFNSFCTPTPWNARRRMEDVLGVRWTGWVGRLFLDADDTDEVPHWLPRLFRLRYPGVPYPEGPMLVLISWNSELVVLSNLSISELVPRAVLTERGKRRFPRASLVKIRRGLPYYYWFGVFEAKAKTRIHAELILPGAIDRVLQQTRPKNPPELVIPLLTELPFGRAWRFYSAGDFADVDFRLPTHAEAGVFKRRCDLAQRVEGVSGAEGFWCFYAPVMRKLLRESSYRSAERRKARKRKQPRPQPSRKPSAPTRPKKGK